MKNRGFHGKTMALLIIIVTLIIPPTAFTAPLAETSITHVPSNHTGMAQNLSYVQKNIKALNLSGTGDEPQQLEVKSSFIKIPIVVEHKLIQPTLHTAKVIERKDHDWSTKSTERTIQTNNNRIKFGGESGEGTKIVDASGDLQNGGAGSTWRRFPGPDDGFEIPGDRIPQKPSPSSLISKTLLPREEGVQSTETTKQPDKVVKYVRKYPVTIKIHKRGQDTMDVGPSTDNSNRRTTVSGGRYGYSTLTTTSVVTSSVDHIDNSTDGGIHANDSSSSAVSGSHPNRLPPVEEIPKSNSSPLPADQGSVSSTASASSSSSSSTSSPSLSSSSSSLSVSSSPSSSPLPSYSSLPQSTPTHTPPSSWSLTLPQSRHTSPPNATSNPSVSSRYVTDPFKPDQQTETSANTTTEFDSLRKSTNKPIVTPRPHRQSPPQSQLTSPSSSSSSSSSSSTSPSPAPSSTTTILSSLSTSSPSSSQLPPLLPTATRNAPAQTTSQPESTTTTSTSTTTTTTTTDSSSRTITTTHVHNQSPFTTTTTMNTDHNSVSSISPSNHHTPTTLTTIIPDRTPATSTRATTVSRLPSTVHDSTHKQTAASTDRPTVSDKPTSFVELNLGMSWADFCPMKMMFRGEVVQILRRFGKRQNGITADQIQLMNTQNDQCMEMSVIGSDKIKVQLYLLNKTHHYDRNLTRDLAQLLKTDFEAADSSVMSKLINVHYRESQIHPIGPKVQHAAEGEEEDDGFFNDPGIAVAISIAVVGASCCVGLIVIQYLWRKRNREGANMSTQETKISRIVYTAKPNRSFSLTSADSIQLYSISSKSSRRRSSGFLNLGLNLSDPLDPTHPLNIDQLSEFCSDNNRIHKEFQKIPNRLPRLSAVPLGEEDKNRYANVLPLPHTRVKLLQDGEQSNLSSYINASYVTGPNNECQYYIATQAPIDKTTGDFWTMVWQQHTTTIVMMTQMEENGQSKSAEYWPELTGKGSTQRHGDFTVELKQKDVNQEYIVSKLELSNLRKIETRTVFHYWYTCWPSHGTPEPISLVKFVLDCRPKYESGKYPLVVHCSPGTGRTCTFIGLDLCMRQFESHRVVDVLKTVNDMRHERAGAVQNKEQYTLIYKAINDYAKIVVSPAVSAASSATTLHALLPS